jgi:hypothetical protein
MAYFDMNIWDEGGYLSSWKASPQYKINFYSIPREGVAYGSGNMIPEYDYYLNWNEVQLLGIENEEDFWIDTDTFVCETKLMPRKLRRHLEKIGVKIA